MPRIMLLEYMPCIMPLQLGYPPSLPSNGVQTTLKATFCCVWIAGPCVSSATKPIESSHFEYISLSTLQSCVPWYMRHESTPVLLSNHRAKITTRLKGTTNNVHIQVYGKQIPSSDCYQCPHPDEWELWIQVTGRRLHTSSWSSSCKRHTSLSPTAVSLLPI